MADKCRPDQISSPSYTARVAASDSLAPVICAPWCVDGDGHPDVLAVDDQWCQGGSHPVELSIAQENAAPEPVLSVWAERFVGEPAIVALAHDGLPELKLTPGEARRLAAALNAVSDQIEPAEGATQ